MSNKLDEIKNKITGAKPGTDELYSQFLPDNPNPNVNTSDNASTENNDENGANLNFGVIPIVKPKKSIRETHKSKAFYIRRDIAKLIEKDIANGQRGDMTKIVNALFEEYYKKQGKLK